MMCDERKVSLEANLKLDLRAGRAHGGAKELGNLQKKDRPLKGFIPWNPGKRYCWVQARCPRIPTGLLGKVHELFLMSNVRLDFEAGHYRGD